MGCTCNQVGFVGGSGTSLVLREGTSPACETWKPVCIHQKWQVMQTMQQWQCWGLLSAKIHKKQELGHSLSCWQHLHASVDHACGKSHFQSCESQIKVLQLPSPCFSCVLEANLFKSKTFEWWTSDNLNNQRLSGFHHHCLLATMQVWRLCFAAHTAFCRALMFLSLIHIWRCRRSTLCRSRWSPYH